MAPRIPASPVVPKARRGFSLLEMLVVIAVSGTLLWGAGTLTVSLLNLRAARRAEHDVHRSLLMLQQQWRTDVRAATQGEIEENGTRLSLRNPAGMVISYRLDGATLLRNVDDDGHLAGRDEYRLPEGSRVRWLWPKQQGAIATLSIEYPAHAADPRSLRTRTLEAVVGGGSALGGDRRNQSGGE
ncbi:MAG: prepilin-type N-terminal cleavage/methylation domain-containing protein [Planctomycetes bacterium]|nr:prepilin-type N-terminal cleavage/methylation domain-containing protein [Planctomycetota bacterium]